MEMESNWVIKYAIQTIERWSTTILQVSLERGVLCYSWHKKRDRV